MDFSAVLMKLSSAFVDGEKHVPSWVQLTETYHLLHPVNKTVKKIMLWLCLGFILFYLNMIFISICSTGRKSRCFHFLRASTKILVDNLWVLRAELLIFWSGSVSYLCLCIAIIFMVPRSSPPLHCKILLSTSFSANNGVGELPGNLNDLNNFGS